MVEKQAEQNFSSPELRKTADGSHTLFHPELNETYHSVHGAIQESDHVFIKAGLDFFIPQNPNYAEINILEIGLGTGLNALLTYIESAKNALKINYTALEAFPVSEKIYSALNYNEVLNLDESQSIFRQIHICDWDKKHQFSSNFSFKKIQTKLEEFTSDQQFNIIYFDAFAPQIQPELWTTAIFEKLYSMMHKNALLVTYCAKGQVRRNMQSAGFLVERLPGPPGKREMMRALKLSEL
ncbi:MAG: SAM-dependent methyltransferase [Sphingobacteriales bacterium]|nr:MAG: SAM-dependent methyltransferase [Sphingobacteriales bacterium]